jgi:Flp pilus assembly protein TadB
VVDGEARGEDRVTVAAAVIAGGLAVALHIVLRRRAQVRRRVGQYRTARGNAGGGRALPAWARRAGERLGRPIVAVVAGASAAFDVEVQLDPALVGAATVAAAVVALIVPPLALPAFASVVAAGWWRARRRRRLDAHALVADLPFVVELFRIALGGGLSVHQAVPVVAERAPARLRGALDAVVERERLGVALADALGELAEVAPALRPLTMSLVAAERDGLPVGPSLERAAGEARMAHRRHAEEAARRLPVQLLFPLVGCVLPAFALLTVVPVLAASVPHLA